MERGKERGGGGGGIGGIGVGVGFGEGDGVSFSFEPPVGEESVHKMQEFLLRRVFYRDLSLDVDDI